MSFGPPILAFCIAVVFTWLELVTEKYLRTVSLFAKKSWALWAYPLLYGVLSFGATFGVDALVSSGALKLEGLGMESPWAQAVALGLGTKALLHIRLFSVSGVPIGTESLVHLVEPGLLLTIELDDFNAVAEYLKPRIARYPDLAVVKTTILSNLPTSFQGKDRASFESDINNAKSVSTALELYLKRFARKTLERVFPL